MRRAVLTTLGLTVLLIAPCVTTAFAQGPARTIYWTDYNGRLLSAPTETGVTSVLVANAGSEANGVGIDGATGRIYWAIRSNSEIHSVLPDGSDEQVLAIAPGTADYPVGIAIDQATRRVYWANSSGPSSIGWASLSTPGEGGLLNIGTAPIGYPQGVVIDAAANRIYWSNTAPPGGVTNGWALLDGSGTGGGLGQAGTGLFAGPVAPALLGDGSALVVPDYNNGNIGLILTDGSAQSALDTTGAGIVSPGGAVADPLTDLVYVANYGGSTIATVNADGSGGSVLVSSGAGTPWGNPALSLVPVLEMTGGTDFGSVELGSSASQTLTFKSTGTDPVGINNFEFSSPGYAITGGNPCAGKTLGPGASCSVTVTFTPTAAGAFNSNLTVTSSAGTKSYGLTGSGAGDPILSSVKPGKRCATSKNAGKLSFSFSISRAKMLGATLDRQKRVRAPRNCPKPQQGGSFAGSVKRVDSASLEGVAGSQTKTLAQAFGTKSLEPGHYRVQLSLRGVDGFTHRRTAWLWVQR